MFGFVVVVVVVVVVCCCCFFLLLLLLFTGLPLPFIVNVFNANKSLSLPLYLYSQKIQTKYFRMSSATILIDALMADMIIY